MPVPLLGEIYYSGIEAVPYLSSVLKIVPWVAIVYLLKLYFSGVQNGNERIMHSKVAIVTVGTCGEVAATVC